MIKYIFRLDDACPSMNHEKWNRILSIFDKYNISPIIAVIPNNQDKLSAHKVHAIAIEITVPERLKTTLNSDIGNLNATGFYEQLTANLKSGNCMLNHASGHLVIQTVNGNISLTAKNAQIISETKTGLVTQQQLVDGNSMFKLKTIKGNINIEQSK